LPFINVSTSFAISSVRSNDLGTVTPLKNKNGASGYLAGRTIWLDAFNSYPDIKMVENGLKTDSINYVNKLNELTAKSAQSLETYFTNGFKIEDPENFTKNFGGFE
jgi:tagatose 1,6-diphosphate aldolase